MRQKLVGTSLSPLFNGNAVLLSSGAQTDRALLSRKKALNWHTKMYLFPLAQIVATYHCFTPTTRLYKTDQYLDFPINPQKTRLKY